MIVQEKVIINNKGAQIFELWHTYSDAGFYILKNGVKYDAAYDVDKLKYTETDIPIPPQPEPPPAPTPDPPEPPPRTLEVVDQELTDSQLALISLYENVNNLSEQLTSTQLALVSVYELIKGGDE